MYNINVKDRKGAILRFLWIVCVQMRHVDGRLFGIFPMSCLWIVLFFFSFSFSLKILSQYSNNNSNGKNHQKVCYLHCQVRITSQCNFCQVRLNSCTYRIQSTRYNNNNSDSDTVEDTHVRSNCQAGKLKSLRTQDSEFVDNFVVQLIWNNEVEATKKSFNRKL